MKHETHPKGCGLKKIMEDEVSILRILKKLRGRISPKWLYTLFFIVAIFGYIGWHLRGVLIEILHKEFEATIQIVDWKGETNPHDIKEELLYGSVLYLENKPIKLSGDFVTFSNLPPSFHKKKVRIHFSPTPKYLFMHLDTVLQLNRRFSTYKLRMRFDGIDKITRQVIDPTSRHPVVGALAEIEGVNSITDKEGRFTINLPLSKQKRYQKLVIKKDGYIDYIDNNLDMTTDNPIIIWQLQKN